MSFATPVRPSPTRPTIIAADPAGDESPEAFAQAVRSGLLADPKTLPCRYFYDDRGSRLFEQICDQPEYYLTRTEDSILRDHADAMVAGWVSDPVMVELGSGSSSKTRRLIAAGLRAYGSLHYVPIDVSRAILEESAEDLAGKFPGLRVTGYAANYRDALPAIAGRFDRPKLFVFLGSSLGNYEADAAVDLLGLLAREHGPGRPPAPRDRPRQGPERPRGRLRRRPARDRPVQPEHPGADQPRARRRVRPRPVPSTRRATTPDSAGSRCTWSARLDHEVAIPGAGLAVRFDRGESIHTENSHKYTPETLRDLADRSGFEEEAAWTDTQGRFRLQRWRLARSVG